MYNIVTTIYNSSSLSSSQCIHNTQEISIKVKSLSKTVFFMFKLLFIEEIKSNKAFSGYFLIDYTSIKLSFISEISLQRLLEQNIHIFSITLNFSIWISIKSITFLWNTFLNGYSQKYPLNSVHWLILHNIPACVAHKKRESVKRISNDNPKVAFRHV